jgi:UDP-glucose 4-epimerase
LKVLITGGAGFIGHHLALHLSSLGYKVLCLDNLSRSSPEVVKTLRSFNIDLIVADVLDINSLELIMSRFKPEVVIHTAALVSVEESVRKPEDYLRCNVLGTLNTVRVSTNYGVSRFIYLSSAAVYGDPIKLPVSEEHPLNPKSPYGLSKLIGEEVVKLYHRMYGLEYVILRLFNVYGPRQSLNPYSGVITKFIDMVCKGLPPVIYGDGTQTRDFIHVLDVCRATQLSISTEYVNEVYNIGSGKPLSINELANLIIRISKLELRPTYEPSRPSDIRHSYADISKAVKYLGFKPSVSIEKGIEELYKNLVSAKTKY